MGNKKRQNLSDGAMDESSCVGWGDIAVPGCIAAFPEASRVIKNALDGPPWTRPDVKVCQSYLSESHDIFSRRSPEPPGSFLVTNGVSIMPSDRFPGRAKVTFGWLNSVPISQAAIAISGVYGEKLDSDQNTVLIQPDANPGDCYHWYSKQKPPANQGDVTKIVVEGLWPDHEYCFYAVYQPNTVPPDATEPGADQASDGEKLSYGWSRPSDISCFTVTWKDSWVMPADPPA